MAVCKKCGTRVGCGCQLKNGLCPACASKPPPIVETVKTNKNVIVQNK